MKVIFSVYAKQELEDVIGFYELEFEGLGRRFKEMSASQISSNLSL